MIYRAVLALGLMLLLGMPAQAAALIVLTPTRSELSENFVGQLRAIRPQDDIVLRQLEAPGEIPAGSLLVTMGQAALAWRLDQAIDAPTIATYVSIYQLDNAGLSSLPASVQVLLANPAPARQLALAGQLLPRLQTVGLLYTPASQSQVPNWQTDARRLALRLNIAEVEHQRELGRRVADITNTSDLLLALDDPNIYNAENLRTLLLTSYARNKVLIGPGAPFISAGSLSTTYSSAADTARSVSDLFEQQWQPASVTYPEHFSVLSNQKVARSLGFPPIDDTLLAQQLSDMEASP